MARWTLAHIPDQSGRTALITGANSGLGLETARALASKGAHVILGCRNVKKGQVAIDDIGTTCPGAKLSLQLVDVSSLASVAEAAASVKEQHSALDLLINNAGIMATPRGDTVDGFEQQFATNHLGHFALTGHFLPLLSAAPAARVVHVSSIAARQGQMRFDDLMHRKGYRPFKVYAQSKLCNQLFAYELQRRLAAADSSVVSIAAHPGFAQTNLLSGVWAAGPIAPLVRPFIPLFWNDAVKGALPQLFAATSMEAEPGGYYGPGGLGEMAGYPKPARPPRAALDESAAKQLWEVSAELSGVRYLM